MRRPTLVQALAILAAVVSGGPSAPSPPFDSEVCNNPVVTSFHGRIREQIASWNEFLAKTPASSPTIAERLETRRVKGGYPIALYKRGKDIPPELSAMEEAADCGGVFTAFLRSMPSTGDPLMGDGAKEVDAGDRTLTGWQIPAGGRIIAVRGQEIYLAAAARSICLSKENAAYREYEIFLAFHPDGRFRILPSQAVSNEKAPVHCASRTIGGFQMPCMEYRDAASGKVRRLLLEGCYD